MKNLPFVVLAFFSLTFGLYAAPVVTNTVVDGQFGPGALYRIVVPDNWNGRLFLYAHGYVDRTAPVELPAEADALAALVTSQGFAIAYSSFSENGWAVKDGAQRTRQLIGIFEGRFGPPTRVYIAGASMGGLIAIKLAEEFPDQFAGALPACAVAGGTREQYNYLSNVRALFDVFYPGYLPGNAGNVPKGIDVNTQIIAPAVAAITSDGGAGAFAIASIDQTPAPFDPANPNELFESIITALVGNASAYSDLVPEELHGKRFFENRTTQYTSSVLAPGTLLAVNASVGRFAAEPSALNYINKYYNPTGNLHIPMVMLSTFRDPVVPGFHQVSYAGRVAASGNSNLLFQRNVLGTGNGYGHCTFTPVELAGAFSDLVAWVEFGIPPTP